MLLLPLLLMLLLVLGRLVLLLLFQSACNHVVGCDFGMVGVDVVVEKDGEERKKEKKKPNLKTNEKSFTIFSLFSKDNIFLIDVF